MADGEAPDYQAAKVALVKLINEKRVENSLEPLKIDPAASAAADAHCQEMVANGFTSHWSLNADKPYQRYHTGGVKDHVSENVVGQDAPDEETFSTDAGGVEKMMKDAQDSFMAEIEPNDLNKQNTLDEKHTHIGIGVACSDKCFRYVECTLTDTSSWMHRRKRFLAPRCGSLARLLTTNMARMHSLYTTTHQVMELVLMISRETISPVDTPTFQTSR